MANIQDTNGLYNPGITQIQPVAVEIFFQIQSIVKDKIEQNEYWTYPEIADYCYRFDITPDQIFWLLERLYLPYGLEFKVGGEDE